MLRRVALVITDNSEELCGSIIRVTRIGEVPAKRRFLREPHGVTSKKTPFSYRSPIQEFPNILYNDLLAPCSSVLTQAAVSQLLRNFPTFCGRPGPCTKADQVRSLSLRHVPPHNVHGFTVNMIRSTRAETNKTNSVTLSPQANYTDWSTATCRRNLVQTFVDRGVSRGQRGGSLTAVNLSFLDRSRYFSFK
jgi:hypothetical protein